MAAPGRHNITFTQGDDYAIQCTFVDEDGAAIPYAGTEVWTAKVRQDPSSATAETFSVAVTGGDHNIVTATLTHTQTLALPENCVWDLVLTTVGGSAATMVAGDVAVLRRVTY